MLSTILAIIFATTEPITLSHPADVGEFLAHQNTPCCSSIIVQPGVLSPENYMTIFQKALSLLYARGSLRLEDKTSTLGSFRGTLTTMGFTTQGTEADSSHPVDPDNSTNSFITVFKAADPQAMRLTIG